MSTIISIFIAIVSILSVFTLFLWIFQGSMLYYPEKVLETTPKEIGLIYEDIKFQTSDGFLLHGWFVPALANRGTLLFLHGNAGNISHRLESIKIFHTLGMNVFIIDYRGYGLSDGKISEQGSYLDAEAALRFLIGEKNIPIENITVFGRSLGGSIASYLASHYKPRGLIIEATFSSVPDMAAKLYPFLPVRWISRFKYNTLNHLKQVDCPVLILHSKNDELVPFVHGQKLYKAANRPKYFVELEGGHNDGFIKTLPRYFKEIDKFLKQELSP